MVTIKLLRNFFGQSPPAIVLSKRISIKRYYCRGMSHIALYQFYITAAFKQLIGRAGMPEFMKDQRRQILFTSLLPKFELFLAQLRFHCETVLKCKH